ncbi:MAG: DciA family protein [Pseudomonadota bacterium]
MARKVQQSKTEAEGATKPGPRPGLRPLATSLRPVMKPLLSRRPPLEAALLLDWTQAVGEDLASLCQPVKLRRERRGGSHVGALEVACLSWGALELQHRSPQMIDRINAFLGVPAVQRLKIRQVSRLPQAAKPKRQAIAPPPEEANLPVLPESGHPGLDRALARLAGSLKRRRDHETAT